MYERRICCFDDVLVNVRLWNVSYVVYRVCENNQNVEFQI